MVAYIINHNPQYLYSEARDECDGWKYRGVAIFAKKENERLSYMIWYGSTQYHFTRLFDAFAAIDLFLQLLIWKFQMPQKITFECPMCKTQLYSREIVYHHYISEHVSDVSDTVSALAMFEYEYGRVLYDVASLDVGTVYLDLWAGGVFTFVGERTLTAIDIEREFRTTAHPMDGEKPPKVRVGRKPSRRVAEAAIPGVGIHP